MAEWNHSQTKRMRYHELNWVALKEKKRPTKTKKERKKSRGKKTEANICTKGRPGGEWGRTRDFPR